jgi:hypothetical protein
MKNSTLALGILAATYGLAVPHQSYAQEIPAQTQLVVRTVDAIDSRSADLAKEYDAGLDTPVMAADGTTVLPRGTGAVLRVMEVQQAGAVKGRASLTLQLFALVVNGQRVPVESSDVTSESGSQGAKATKGGILEGRTLTISLQALNDGADRQVAISRDAVQIVDDAGNAYRATRVLIGNQEERSELISGIRTNISLIFDGVQASAIARLRAKVRLGPQVQGAPDSGEDLEFRNLAVRKN